MQRIASLLSSLALLALTSAPAQAQWTTDNLSAPRGALCAVTVDGLALFAGGGASTGSPSDIVDIYDLASGTWSFAHLSVARGDIGATVVGHLAVFAGGGDGGSGPMSAAVDVFDAQTMSWFTATLSQARCLIAATSVGSKAIFAGGATQLPPLVPIASAVVDIYDAQTNSWSTATLSRARAYLAAASVGNKALFAGGADGLSDFGLATVDIYDDSTASWSIAALSQARLLNAASSARVGTRAYFAGGLTVISSYTTSNVVDIYDAQTNSWSTATLSMPRWLLAAGGLGNTVLFAGGVMDGSFPISPLVEILDATSGNWLTPGSLAAGRFNLAATTVGGKAMFAGGFGGGGTGPSDLVDVYEAGGPPTPFCFGDGGGLSGACPCNNYGLSGRGCENSGATGGAVLDATGNPSLASDTLVLHSSGELPASLSIFLQGSALIAPLTFGDGVRCVAGSLKRLYVHSAFGGVASAPQPGEPSISARSAALGSVLSEGSTRYYQVYYRDPVLGFCASPPGNSWNISSGLIAVWGQ